MSGHHGYSCPRCLYKTSVKKNFKQHLSRKTECKQHPSLTEDITFVCVQERFRDVLEGAGSPDAGGEQGSVSGAGCRCSLCGKSFACRQSLYTHVKKQRCKPASTGGLSVADSDLSNMLQDMDQKLNELLHAKTVERDREPAPTVTINHVTNTTNVQNNLNLINAFGKEDLTHLSDAFMTRCVRRTDRGLVDLVEKIHFDQEKRANNNIRITNKKMPFIEYHNGARWIYEKKDKVLSDLIDKGTDLLEQHLESKADEIQQDVSESMFEYIMQWMEQMQSHDKKVLEPIIMDMYLVILNNTPARG